MTPAGVHVAVLNGNGVNGAAGKAVAGLQAWGYHAHPGNASGTSSRPQPPTTGPAPPLRRPTSPTSSAAPRTAPLSAAVAA